MRSTISTSYPPVERQGVALLAVGGVIGDMADLAERLDQIVGRVAVVFDDEKAHGSSIAVLGMATRRTAWRTELAYHTVRRRSRRT